jgi:membrane protein implicated in regulation of membrane protease activity
MRKYVLRIVAVEPFLTLGKASLHVFCAHVFFVFVGLALLYSDVPQLHGWVAVTLLAVTFAGLVLVAVREVRKQREDRAKRAAGSAQAQPSAPPSIQLRSETEPLAAPLP